MQVLVSEIFIKKFYSRLNNIKIDRYSNFKTYIARRFNIKKICLETKRLQLIFYRHTKLMKNDNFQTALKMALWCSGSIRK